jgi:outer membrane protein TolC
MRNSITVSFKLFLAVVLGLPAGLSAQQSLPLNLRDAVSAALEPDGNVRVQLAAEAVRQAEAHANQVRANLLPDVSASIGTQSQTRNLSAYGFQAENLGTGFDIPRVVGPFNTFDARGTVTQKLFDLSSIRRYQAARVGTAAAREESESVRDQTAAEVARAYLFAVRGQALVETAQANVQLSEALLRLAESQKEAGTGTGIEVTRAQVQLANNRQLLLVSQADFTKARLELLKTLGTDLDVQVELTDRLQYTPAPAVPMHQAVSSAYELLAEFRAQRKREETAALNHRATTLERLPYVVGFADYGTIGKSATHNSPTRTFGASIQIPLFDGGRREARRAESLSQLRQEEIRSADLRQGVELRIRVALDAVDSAMAQVRAAEDGVGLAGEEMEQAERRYKAGVTSSIEVTDAQTRLQRSRENRISALFNHALARVDLASAMGNIQELVNNWR